VASCLVPFPYAVDDHQTSNARFLQQAGAAKLMPQDDMTPTRLAQWIESLNRDQLTEMAQRALQCAKPMATARVAAVCKELVTS
jgi:UDP-N-acetylglucosamine--N-acetylmuramyl-(pentapeptide) pyrophosphoryl-undecaprenol N-acetylglucosamine transferase